jgi:hypothetical protein
MLSHADAARRLGISEGVVTVAIHRLRRSVREMVKGEIARTPHDPAQVGDELACLVAALGGG